MRKTTVALATGILLLVPQVAQAESYGPGWDGTVWSSPTYSLPIHIVDSVALRFAPGTERRAWRTARNRALENWGLPFVIDRMPDTALPHVFDGSAIEDMTLPDAILLTWNYTEVMQETAGWVPEAGGGIAVFAFAGGWWKSYQSRTISGVIGHEIGHALGFTHGGNGIMWGRSQPSDLDRSLAAAYYLGR